MVMIWALMLHICIHVCMYLIICNYQFWKQDEKRMKIKFVPIWMESSRYETHTKNNKGQVCRNICRNDMSRVIATIKEWLPCQIQTGGFRTSQFLPATWALKMGFRYPLAIRQSGHFSGEHDGSHYGMSMDVHGIYWAPTAPSLETSRHSGILGHIKRHA
jgi:hypothetical protein